jgi:Na+/melibiose symporter-like transporter
MRLSPARLIGFAAGALGTGVFTTVPSVLLLFFCTETLHMSPVLAGAAVLLPKLWAVVLDPTIGVLSDRTRTRLGRRRPFLLAGAIGVPLAFLGLFAWPYPGGDSAFWPVAIIYFLLANTYSLFAVPFIAIPAEISPDVSERERVVAWRIGAAMIGVLIGAGLAPVLVQYGHGGRQGYAFMALVVSFVCGVAMLSTFLTAPSDSQHAPVPAHSWRETLAVIWAAKSLQRLALAYVLQIAAVGLVSALTPYWVHNVAHEPETIVGLLLGTLLVVTIAATPAWAIVIRKIGARRATASAALLYVVAALCFDLLRTDVSLPHALILYAFMGVPFAGIQVGPYALAAHRIHDIAAKLGNPKEGMFTGVWTASEKLGLAFGPSIAGIALAVIGFQSGASAQSPLVLGRLASLLSFGPACLFLISLPLLLLWDKD